MGLFSFIKEAGEKLFGHKEVEQAVATGAPNLAELNQKAADAIKTYVETQNLGLSGLTVGFDGASGKVTLGGNAPSQEAAERPAWPLATWPASAMSTTTCSTRPAPLRNTTTWCAVTR